MAQAERKTKQSKGKQGDEERVVGRPFRPGQSGNPSGRPKGLASATRDVLKQAVEDGEDSALALARFWASVMSDPAAKMEHRLEASRLLADRGWGKAPQFAPIEDADPLERRDVSEDAVQGLFRDIDEVAAKRREREERDESRRRAQGE